MVLAAQDPTLDLVWAVRYQLGRPVDWRGMRRETSELRRETGRRGSVVDGRVAVRVWRGRVISGGRWVGCE